MIDRQCGEGSSIPGGHEYRCEVTQLRGRPNSQPGDLLVPFCEIQKKKKKNCQKFLGKPAGCPGTFVMEASVSKFIHPFASWWVDPSVYNDHNRDERVLFLLPHRQSFENL